MDDELRSRFNPDGSLLRRHQMRMLEMLVEFDAVCKKNGIRYWLSSGTLLGCVRHGGFIPWDDDLDIEMMRDDYLRLSKVLKKELPENLIIQDHETDRYYFFSYPKLRDKNSFLEEVNQYDQYFDYQGIYIDIFLLEKSWKWLQRLSCNTIGHIYKILKKDYIPIDKKKKNILLWYNVNHKLIYPAFRFASLFCDSKCLRHTFGTPFLKPRLLSDLFPLKEGKFEGFNFPIPNNADHYLKCIYGDYMKLPKNEDIHPHYNKLTIN